MSEEEKTKINIMLKDRDIDNILERELSLDRYCYVHNYIASLKIEKDNLLEENKQLKEIVENLTTMTVYGDRKQIKNTAQYKLEQLQKVLTELEEWLNTYKSVGYEDIGTFQVVLDKIQELKEKYK